MRPEEHLRRADKVLGGVMDDVGGPPPEDPDVPGDDYGVLVRAIVSQNISIHASRAIFRRLKDRFGGRVPAPEELLADDPEQLRPAVGLSHAKTVSLRSLAECLVSGALDLGALDGLPDEEVVAKLDVVKGIGVWTADMFLMFGLRRPDVLPTGDLELRRIVAKVYGLAAPPSPAELTRLAEPWRPYRTLACRYLWQLAEQAPRL